MTKLEKFGILRNYLFEGRLGWCLLLVDHPFPHALLAASASRPFWELLWIKLTKRYIASWLGVVGKSDFNDNPVVGLDLELVFELRLKACQNPLSYFQKIKISSFQTDLQLSYSPMLMERLSWSTSRPIAATSVDTKTLIVLHTKTF